MSEPPSKNRPEHGPVHDLAKEIQDRLDEEAAQRERAAGWVRDNWKAMHNCIVCGSNNWQVGDVLELRPYRRGALIVGNVPIYPVFPVTCNVCGNTILINAVRSGVIEGGEKPPEPEINAGEAAT